MSTITPHQSKSTATAMTAVWAVGWAGCFHLSKSELWRRDSGNTPNPRVGSLTQEDTVEQPPPSLGGAGKQSLHTNAGINCVSGKEEVEGKHKGAIPHINFRIKTSLSVASLKE